MRKKTATTSSQLGIHCWRGVVPLSRASNDRGNRRRESTLPSNQQPREVDVASLPIQHPSAAMYNGTWRVQPQRGIGRIGFWLIASIDVVKVIHQQYGTCRSVSRKHLLQLAARRKRKAEVSLMVVEAVRTPGRSHTLEPLNRFGFVDGPTYFSLRRGKTD